MEVRPGRMLPAFLALSAAGLIAIMLHEGYRSQAYDDGRGIYTIGYGTTIIDGRPVQPGDRIDPVSALKAMDAHLDDVQRTLRRCLADVPLFAHEWDAFVSLAYNIGAHTFCRSTAAKLLRKSPPDYAGACEEILRWHYAGGRSVPGLKKRREAEYRRCLGQGGKP